MLKKRERLTKKDFDAYFRCGKRVHDSLFTLVYTPHEEFHGAVVVGKKVSKKAVVRNKLRRRTYNALYMLKKEQDLHGVFIILTKPLIQEASFTDIKDSITTVVGCLNKKR